METNFEGDTELYDLAREEPYELTGFEEHMDHENGAFGDARRCPHHPEVKTSSDDGMFDCDCYKCEGEMDDASNRWDYDPENPRRPYCGTGEVVVGLPRWGSVCVPEDNIPF